MSENLTNEQLSALTQAAKLVDKARVDVHHNLLGQAESAYKQALLLRSSAVGEGHVSVGELLEELGVLYQKAGRWETAQKALERSLSILESNYYPLHGRLGPVLEHISDCLVAQNQYAKAEEQCKRALEIYDKTLSGEHRLTLETTIKLAQIYRHLEKYTDATTLLTKAIKQVESPLGPAEEFRFELALNFEAQGKAPEAETNFKQAIDGFEQRGIMFRLADALSAYADFLKKNGRAEDARANENRARHLREISKTMHQVTDPFPSTLLRA